MANLEEIRLVALCMAADNREAFSRLVVMHQDALRRFLLNLCNGNGSVADDLAQETFMKAWLAIRSFKMLSGFRTWLFRIAINEYVSYRRRSSQAFTGLDDDAAGRVVDPSDRDSQTESRLDVQTLLRELSEPERIVVLLFYLQELPMKEIVKITGMPMGTVKSHLSRARARLAKVK